MNPTIIAAIAENLRAIGQRLKRLFESLATPAEHIPPAFWVAVYLAGLLGWVLFFRSHDTGDQFYRAVDWPKERQYFGVIKQSLQTSTLPWHTSIPLQPSQPTDRYLAIPETLSLLAPQTQAIRWLSLEHFVLFNHLLMYTIGALGWYALSRRFRFPPLVATTGFALFAFNGHLVAHIAAGHSMWSSYYWLPWFMLPVIESCKRPPTLRQAMLIALALGAIVLQGGCHLYVWCLFFLALFFVANPLRHRMLAVAALLSGLLAAHRFAPAALVFQNNVHRIKGFSTGSELGLALLSGKRYAASIFPWEFDSYISPVGALFLLVSLTLPLLLPVCRRALRCYWPLVLPVVAFTMLSLRAAPYLVATYLPLPLWNTQRVPSRLMLLPLVFTITMACIGATILLSNALRQRRALIGAVGLVAAGTLVVSLWRHAAQWRMSHLEAIQTFHMVHGEKPIPDIVFRHDPVYVAVVWSGLAVSLLTLAAMVWWLWRTSEESEDKEVQGAMY